STGSSVNRRIDRAVDSTSQTSLVGCGIPLVYKTCAKLSRGDFRCCTVVLHSTSRGQEVVLWTTGSRWRGGSPSSPAVEPGSGGPRRWCWPNTAPTSCSPGGDRNR